MRDVARFKMKQKFTEVHEIKLSNFVDIVGLKTCFFNKVTINNHFFISI